VEQTRRRHGFHPLTHYNHNHDGRTGIDHDNNYYDNHYDVDHNNYDDCGSAADHDEAASAAASVGWEVFREDGDDCW
jgi:hypothetical protein